MRTSKNSKAFLFGKSYRWAQSEDGLELIPDHQLSLFPPDSIVQGQPVMEPKFTQDLALNKSTLAAQAALYAVMIPKEHPGLMFEG